MDRYALAIVGSGSGNTIVPDNLGDRQVALIEHGVFGGTCLNRGCIPTKMFVYTADVAMQIRDAARFGVTAEVEKVDWPAIRDRILSRVEATSHDGRKYRLNARNADLYEGHARFSGPNELTIDGETTITADQIVIATGGRPRIPPIVLASGVPFQTSDTVMQLDELPASMVILGGGYIAAEMAHIFGSLGVEIRLVERSPRLLRRLDTEIGERFTAEAETKWNVCLNSTVAAVQADEHGVTLALDDGRSISGEVLLVATGRQPNTDDLGVDLADVSLRDDGHIAVDDFGRAAPSIWAFGDCASPYELKHVANAEARIVAHNLSHPDDLLRLPHDWVPAAVFTDPQIAAVGATSQDLQGRSYVEATQLFSDTAYGWALQDHVGVCKLYADPETGLLLGAHILGYQASILIQPLIQAVTHGQRVADLARGEYWIHPALSEVVENALLKLPLDHRVRSGQATDADRPTTHAGLKELGGSV